MLREEMRTLLEESAEKRDEDDYVGRRMLRDEMKTE